MLNLNIEYISSGKFKSKGVWIHPRRIIDTYEIIFMLEGSAYITEENKEYILKKNDILLLEPGKEHFGFKESDEFVSFFWIHYITENPEYKNFTKHITITDPYILKTLFSQSLHISNTPSYSPVSRNLYMALIIEEILSHIKSSERTPNYLASQIKDYVKVNIENNPTVNEIAKHFGYHENHISRVFKSAYGTTLKKYIEGQILEYSRNLLHTTLYTVNQISRILSFKSENHFIKFFKYHTEMTPTEYRNSFSNTHTNKK